MASIVSQVAALAMAGVTLLSSTIHTAAPHNDIRGTMFLVNREWRVSENYIPDLSTSKAVKGRLPQMTSAALQALIQMVEACKAETKVTLISISTYRSYQKQKDLYTAKLAKTKSQEAANQYVAMPGASEHQLGMAIDLGNLGKGFSLGAAFGKTKGGKWMKDNAHRFGFILRYNEGWENVTGYSFEPWHFRYVGVDVATRLYNHPEPFEHFLLTYREETLREILNAAP